MRSRRLPPVLANPGTQDNHRFLHSSPARELQKTPTVLKPFYVSEYQSCLRIRTEVLKQVSGVKKCLITYAHELADTTFPHLRRGHELDTHVPRLGEKAPRTHRRMHHHQAGGVELAPGNNNPNPVGSNLAMVMVWAIRASCFSCSAPSSPTSEKPAVITTTARTPFSPHSFITPATRAAGTAIRATSGASGRSDMDG